MTRYVNGQEPMFPMARLERLVDGRARGEHVLHAGKQPLVDHGALSPKRWRTRRPVEERRIIPMAEHPRAKMVPKPERIPCVIAVTMREDHAVEIATLADAVVPERAFE